MLDIAKLGAQSANYYLREAADSLEAYLQGEGEAPGQWVGMAAHDMGLSGQVTEDQFLALFRGCNPKTGVLLGRPHRENAVPAFDHVFRPTKSVSVLWGLAEPEVAKQIADAHHAGIDKALAYLDAHVGTRRGTNGVRRIAADGLLAARYDHRTSRAGDPLLHSHVIVPNRVRGEDGRWLSIDGRDLYGHATAADSLYRAEYQRRLTEQLGVQWGPASTAGNREISGIPEQFLKHFSKRREAIELELESRQADGLPWSERVADWVAHVTRPPKEEVAPATLRDKWRSEVTGLGHDADDIVRSAINRSRTPETVNARKVFDTLAGPNGLTANRSTFTARDVIVAVGAQASGIGADKVEELAAAFLRDKRVLQVSTPSTTRGIAARYSTEDLLRVEQRLLDNAVGRQGEGVGIAKERAVRWALGRRQRLSDEQRQMVEAITRDGHGVSVVIGRAGTGKTTALEAARLAWEESGISVFGATPTGVAATQLEHGAGISSSTIDSMLTQVERKRFPARSGSVLVVDEAGMVDTRKLERLTRWTRSHGVKLVLVGDDHQLQSVEAGGGFRALTLRLPVTRLQTVRRQENRVDREALDMIRAGDGEGALRLYDQAGRVAFVDSPEQLRTEMVKEWLARHADGQDVVMLTATREAERELNALAREMMREKGNLGGMALTVRGDEYRVGDHIMCRVNDRRSNAAGANGRPRFKERRTADIASGARGVNDRRAVGVANGTRGVVERIDPIRSVMDIRVQRDGKKDEVITLTPRYLGKQRSDGGASVQHAYAITTHRTQALTVDEVLIDAGGSTSNEWWYTALSRVRASARIFALETPRTRTDDIHQNPSHTPPDSRAMIEHGMSRSEGAVLATDAEREQLRPLTRTQLETERDALREELKEALRRIDQPLIDKSADLARAEKALTDVQDQIAIDNRRGRDRKVDLEQQTRQAELTSRESRAQTVVNDLRRYEQRRAQHTREAAQDIEHRLAAIEAELAHRDTLGVRRLELDPPAYVEQYIGRPPSIEAALPQREAWREAATAIEHFVDTFGIDEMRRALAVPAMPPTDLTSIKDRVTLKQAVERALGMDDRGRERSA